jgi:hypothetical protein
MPRSSNKARKLAIEHFADRFARHGQLTPVQVVEANDVSLQPGNAFVDVLTHVGNVTADWPPAGGALCRVAADAEFRRHRRRGWRWR